MKRTIKRIITMVSILAAMVLPMTGCTDEPVVGAINDTATVALIQFEAQEDGISGVVYRQINRFTAFLAVSDVPVLVAFYSAFSADNALIIPQLEQMADDYRGKLQIVWVDAGVETELAASFGVEKLPQFTVVVDGALKRSLIGYDDQGAVRIKELLAPYLGDET